MNSFEISDQIKRTFSLSEIKDLSFRLSIEYEDLPGETRSDKIREIVSYCIRHNRIEDLIVKLGQVRPNLKWEYTEKPIQNLEPSFSHILHRYPRGPMVDAFRVRRSIMLAFATFVDPSEAHSIIGEANAFRKEADPDDPTVTLIKLGNLPPPLNVRPMSFWAAAFGEACLHGPRMLAALLLVVSETQFPQDAKVARDSLLKSLREN